MQEGIQERTLSDVRAPHERDLGTIVGWELLPLCGPDDEGGVVEHGRREKREMNERRPDVREASGRLGLY
jgi:hypothetical protein